jgi:cell division septation protein DedD
VNPSLTISAVCERAASELVARSVDLGLPAPPPGFAPGTPQEIVGDRVVAPDNDPPAPASPAAPLAQSPAPESGGVAAQHRRRRRHRRRRKRRGKHRHGVR